MNLTKKDVAIIALSICLCASLLLYVNFETSHKTPKVNAFLFFETAKGSWSGQSGNLITNIGENYVGNILGFNNVTAHNATKWISVSNDATPLVTWTELGTEIAANGFNRSLGTVAKWANGTDVAYNVSNKFTSTGSQQLQCAGLQWNDTPLSDNNLFAAATFTQTTFASGDNLTITWVITWDAN